MTRLLPAVTLVTAVLSTNAFAACGTNQVVDIETEFGWTSGTYRITGTHATNGETYNEVHKAGGVLCEVALGSGHSVDPSKDIGTWAVNSNNSTNATVTYKYGNPVAYTFTFYVYKNLDGTYDFCFGTAGGAEVPAAQRLASVTCP